MTSEGPTRGVEDALQELHQLAGPMFPPLARSAMSLVVTDPRQPDNPIVFVNGAFERLTGYASAEVVGRNCRFLQAPESARAAIDQLREAIRTGQPIETALLNVRKDGSRFVNQLSLTPLRTPQGELAFFLGVQADITAARDADRATQALADREHAIDELNDRLRLLLSGASAAASWRWELQADRLHGDARLAAIYGRPPEDFQAGIPAQVFFSIIHPEDRIRVRLGVSAVLNGAEVFSKDFRIQSATEGMRWVRAEGRTEFDLDDRPVRFCGAMADITQQKRMEERLRIAQTAGGIGAFEYVEGHATVSVSAQFCALLGLHPSAVLPIQTLNALVHGQERLIESGAEGALPGEFCLRRPDTGEIRWIARRGETVRDLVTGHLRQIGVIYDITASKEAERKLRSLNEELEQRVADRTRERDRTWRLSPVLMVVASTDGVLQAVNPAWTATLGWTEEETVGRNVREYLAPEDQETGMGGHTRLDGDRTVTEHQSSFITKAGETRRIAWNTLPEDDRLFAFGRDITDQLLAEDRLRHALKMEAVGQLTGGIAHDFNNLLTGIVGSLDLLQARLQQGRSDKLERYIQGAQSSANRAAALTHRLLAFSRRQPLETKAVAPNTLISGMEELFRRTLSERIQLEFVAAGGLWTTLCDPNQLENALLNLAINARDAMPGGGRLTIETCNTHLDRAYAAQNIGVEPGQYICICVTDTGSGMTPAVVARAFDPFFTTKPLGHGTGLGLSMIYGFAKQSGGHVAIYSELGKGTTIKLYLPRFRGEVVPDWVPPPPRDLQRAELGETVLVVEDETIVRELVVEVLQDLGYNALEAYDGASGLAILSSDQPIDLVVTDVGLPDLNGRQMVDQARERRKDLKVLFITGYAENAMFGNGHLEPGMQMITKPFPVDALAARIREMIEQ